MFYNLICFDIRTMIGVLFWGNLTSALLIFSYQAIRKSGFDKEYVKLLYFSRFIKAGYYFLIFFRGTFPDIISVNIGNTLMFISLYMDGYLMFNLSGISVKKPYHALKGILIGSVVLFNFIDILFQEPGLRVSLSSLFMFAILIMPSAAMMFMKNNSRFAKILGLFYAAALIVSITRSVYSFAVEPIYIFTDNVIHSLSFISLTLIMVFSAPGFLLIMKENSDALIENMAIMDGLTNIQNRQSFMNLAQECFERHKIMNRVITILFFDIDFFKKVNDTYGHSFGDEVLVRFAEIIKRNMRSDDLSCRYGGEEFLALLPGCDEKIGLAVCERIMKEIDELNFDGAPSFKFTASIGIYTGAPFDGDTLSAFINKADMALYEAKNNGRNKIVIYSKVLNDVIKS